MKILLLGGRGQLGFELQRSLVFLGKVLAPDRYLLDLTKKEIVEASLKKINPDLIVNAAAWTDVNAAEENEIIARRLNTDLSRQIAEYAFTNNTKVIHYSTDYVYPGGGTEPWDENSPTGPLNVYGQTKLEGDQAIQQSGCKHLIFRTSWVYSASGNNFMNKIITLAKSKKELDVVADQFGAPTTVRLIAQLTALSIKTELKTGLYNLSSRGETSWYNFAKDILALALQTGESFKLDPRNINPIVTSQFSTPARRPLNSRLTISKLEKALNIELPVWSSELHLTFHEYMKHNLFKL
ncbi:dTDP-4-dehydrorhamnose reductase [Candidatus Levibacter sp. Uisw_134_01]|uniref:dTDP-4-dehydrorhamnose reductase n=1 Tax=Candidatus Levibacter sp. Uisw_134_01 TaxID=3230999 RepID=UPI003D39FEBB